MTEQTDRVSEIGQRLTQATPGPWASYLGGLWCGATATELARADHLAAEHAYSDEAEDIFDRAGQLFYGDVKRAEDAEFIAAAPDDIRYLLAEIARLSAVIERVRTLCGEPILRRHNTAGDFCTAASFIGAVLAALSDDTGMSAP